MGFAASTAWVQMRKDASARGAAAAGMIGRAVAVAGTVVPAAGLLTGPVNRYFSNSDNRMALGFTLMDAERRWNYLTTPARPARPETPPATGAPPAAPEKPPRMPRAED